MSEAEYIEAKEIIQSKYGGEHRQLRADMEELEKIVIWPDSIASRTQLELQWQN